MGSHRTAGKAALLFVGLFATPMPAFGQRVADGSKNPIGAARGDQRIITLRSMEFRFPIPGNAESATGWRKAAQIFGGILGAGAVGVGAWAALDDPGGSGRRVKGDAGYTPNANTAYAVGSFLGCTGLVYLIGRGDGSRGSLWATAIGSGVATIPLLLGRNEPYTPLFGVVIAAPLQAIGATIGYQKTRGGPG